MDNPTIYGLALIPIVVGLVKVLEIMGLSKRFLPLSSIVIGVLMGIFYGVDTREGVLMGVYIGLSAVGLHSSVKSVMNGVGNGNGNGNGKS